MAVAPLVHVLYTPGVFTQPPGWPPFPPARFASTPGDNLAEFSGRVAYDSFYNGRGRDSAAYHAHILETRHNSVYAHAVETFEFASNDAALTLECLQALQLRPGVWVTEAVQGRVRFALSLRAVIEWQEHGIGEPTLFARTLGDRLVEHLKPLYPLALSARTFTPDWGPPVRRVEPETPHERWASLYVEGVSRDLLQELVRHHWQANPSVRSTRYVDEADSTQIVHPALEDHADLAGAVQAGAAATRALYARVFAGLCDRGVDTKTARGAARSALPGATETRLVFSLSAFQAAHLLALRGNQATGAVDPEIRRLAALMRAALETVWPPA